MSKLFDFSNFHDSKAIITDDGTELLYKDLDANVNYLSLNIESRCFAFCFCENVIGSLIGYIAFMKAGTPVVMIDGTKDLEILNNYATIYQPNYIWIPSRRLEEFGNFKSIFSFHDYTLIEYSSKKHKLFPDLSLMLTTSGSTGSPKLVRLTFNNVESNAKSIAEYLEIDSHEKPITSMPMHYSYGLSVINSHLLKGATILLTNKTVIQREFWEFAKNHSATSISGVPYTYEILKKIKFFNMKLPSLKTMTQAGGKLNAVLASEYVEQAKLNNKKFIIMYGQTEATARMSYLPWEFATSKYKSIGIAIPRGVFSLLDDNRNQIKDNNIEGELIYKGPNVSLGYAECIDDLSNGDENYGILHTGDIAIRDEDGFYYITGRLKRFVKLYGNRCNLDSLEQIVKCDLGIECACSGVDDKVTIFLTDKIHEKEAINLLSKKTGINKNAFTTKVISSIPTNSSGKIQYSELLTLLT